MYLAEPTATEPEQRRATQGMSGAGPHAASMMPSPERPVRRFYEDISRGDHAAALACLAPDAVFTVSQEGTVQGRDAIRAMWERWEGDWEQVGPIAEEFIDVGDQIVVTVDEWGRGRGSGIEVDARFFNVFTFRDGQVVRKVEFTGRAEALEAAGLPD
jgi:ketosteroid isomerase-like protein